MKSIAKIVFGILLSVFILFILLIFVFSNGDSTPKTTKVTSNSEKEKSVERVENKKEVEYKIGDTIRVLDREVTVNSVRREMSLGPYNHSREGYEFIVVNFTVKNVDDEDIDLNRIDFKVQDENGVQRDYDTSTYRLDDALESVDIAPNGQITGSLAFEVPEGSSAELIYQPNMWLDKHRVVIVL